MDGKQRHYLDTAQKSWVDVARNVLPLSAEEFESVWSACPDAPPRGRVMGMDVEFPRFTQGYGDAGDYPFAGQVARSRPLAHMPCLDRLKPLLAAGYNSALFNFYRAEAGHYIGPHSDDERGLQKGHDILSLTWADGGHFRRFRLTPKKGAKNASGLTLELRNGDVVVMGGQCQVTHKHEVMKIRKSKPQEGKGRRVNVTLRRLTQGEP